MKIGENIKTYWEINKQMEKELQLAVPFGPSVTKQVMRMYYDVSNILGYVHAKMIRWN